jgi:hypothetical protein
MCAGQRRAQTFGESVADVEVDALAVMAQMLSDGHREVAVEKPPMEIEIVCCLAKPKPARNVDILQWWKEQSSTLPLLAEEVQK